MRNILCLFAVLIIYTTTSAQNSLKGIIVSQKTNEPVLATIYIPQLEKGTNTDFDGEYMQGKRLKRVISTLPDTFNQIINIHFHLEWDEDEGRKSDDWHTRLRYYFRFELEHLIERSKFGKYRIMGDYLGNPINRSSKDFVVECEKTG